MVRNLPTGTHGVYVDGERKSVAEVIAGGGDGGIEAEILVDGEEVDVVLSATSTHIHHSAGKL